MNIKDIHAYVLRHELSEPFGFSQWWYYRRDVLLVEVETDEGISGFGEAYGPAKVIEAAVLHFFKPLVVGRQADDPEGLWEALYTRSCDYGRKGIMLSAISAIDIALWDIRGKAAGQPVYKLLGGADRVVDQIPAYASGMYFFGCSDLAATLADEAARNVEEGFSGMKMKIGLSLGEDLANVAAVRQRIAEGPLLMVDANHAYDVAGALRMSRELEEYSITWFEEPVSPDDLDGYRRVRDESRILIAGGECEFTRYGFAPFIRGGCADIIQPDPCAAGGISETRKIVALADESGLPVVLHTWGSGVAIAVALHLNAGLFAGRDPSGCPFPWPWIELDRTENPFRESLLVEPLELNNGNLTVPQGPGLGIEIDRDVLESYRVI